MKTNPGPRNKTTEAHADPTEPNIHRCSRARSLCAPRHRYASHRLPGGEFVHVPSTRPEPALQAATFQKIQAELRAAARAPVGDELAAIRLLRWGPALRRERILKTRSHTWKLKTPPAASDSSVRDEEAEVPPALVVQVGKKRSSSTTSARSTISTPCWTKPGPRMRAARSADEQSRAEWHRRGVALVQLEPGKDVTV